MAGGGESEAEGQKTMSYRRVPAPLCCAILLAGLWASPVSRAQDPSGENQGLDSGGYNIQQTMEVGYRANWVNGNEDTYDTFINLGSGVRLLDYSVEMRSLGHHGLLFDNLSFSSFAYGGDPNDVSRLRIQKNKYYDFRALFRRDKNFWDWNLLANPLNPITTNAAVSPTTPITSSPHALDLVRRMQDYDLTLFSNSRVRWRLGYSRNRDEGPGFFTTDGGTISAFPQNFSYTTNATAPASISMCCRAPRFPTTSSLATSSRTTVSPIIPPLTRRTLVSSSRTARLLIWVLSGLRVAARYYRALLRSRLRRAPRRP